MGKKKNAELSVEDRLEKALIPESEQSYKIPDNWVWTRMNNVAKWGSGVTPSIRTLKYYVADIPWIKTGELNFGFIYDTEEHISDEAIEKSSSKLYPINTVVIAMYGATIGKVAIMGVSALTNQACACGVYERNMYYKYLFHYAVSQQDIFINIGKSGTQPNISQEVIKKHIIPIPTLSEKYHII